LSDQDEQDGVSKASPSLLLAPATATLPELRLDEGCEPEHAAKES
jgi:hypothetical protein